MVFEHVDEYGSQWAAIRSIAGKIGCSVGCAMPAVVWIRGASTRYIRIDLIPSRVTASGGDTSCL